MANCHAALKVAEGDADTVLARSPVEAVCCVELSGDVDLCGRVGERVVEGSVDDTRGAESGLQEGVLVQLVLEAQRHGVVRVELEAGLEGGVHLLEELGAHDGASLAVLAAHASTLTMSTV